VKIYDLDKDELLIKGESTAAREDLLLTLDYDGYAFGQVTAYLYKDESVDPVKAFAKTNDAKEFTRLAKNPQIPLTAVAGAWARHNLSDDQKADIIRARPELANNRIYLTEVLSTLRFHDMPDYMGGAASNSKTMEEVFKAIDAHPSAAALRTIAQYKGAQLSPEQVDKFLDLKEKYGFKEPVPDITRNPKLADQQIERILNPEQRTLYGAPSQNFEAIGAERLKPKHIEDIINRGDFYPHMAWSPNFNAKHMHMALNHPETDTRRATQGLSTFYNQGKGLPTPDAAKIIQKASRYANIDDDNDLSTIAIHAGRHDPKVFDHLDDNTLKAVIKSAYDSASLDHLIQAGRANTGRGGGGAPIDATNAPRVVRLMKLSGSMGAHQLTENEPWKEVLNSPDVPEQDKAALRRYQAQHFWHSYERNVFPQHFAAITKWQTGDPEHVEVNDHRGARGSSDEYPGIEPGLAEHAAASQRAVAADPNMAIKDIDGKPHVLVYRGVGGDYAHKVAMAVGKGAQGIELPTAAFSSWSADPREALSFSKRSIKGQEKSGILMRRWAPLDTVIHTGFHQLEPGHLGVHPEEQEMVFDHRNEKHLRIPAADINVSRFTPESAQAFTDSGAHMVQPLEQAHNDLAAPHIKAKAGLAKAEGDGFVRIPLTDSDHWSNLSSELRKLPKELP
jgi:hypothetical protein